MEGKFKHGSVNADDATSHDGVNSLQSGISYGLLAKKRRKKKKTLCSSAFLFYGNNISVGYSLSISQ